MLYFTRIPVDACNPIIMKTEERIITISTATILRAVAAILLLVFIWIVRDIIALVFVALILAALMLPFAQWMKKFRIPSPVSVLLFYGFLIGIVALVGVIVIPQIIRQLSDLGSMFTSSWTAAMTRASVVKAFIVQHGLEQNVQNSISSIETYIGQVVGNVYDMISGFIGGVAALVLVFVLAFYMVAEEREAVRFFKNIIPEDYQEFAANLLYEVERKFSRWLVGQVVLCVIIGLCYFIGLSIIGVDGALTLSILAGFFEFVPYLGPILSGIVIILVAFTQAPLLAVFATALMLIIQWLENNLLVPKVMQKAVGLNPVLSIVALLVGAKIFGFVGMILSIPVTTGVSVALTEYFRYQKEKKK